ncbi:MAG: hypothetical protein MJ169_08720 [Treponema sp.]|nr:hypothetical protein [Treponema sp.]
MSKSHRGTGVRTLPNHGRGTCAICKKDGVKTLYEKEVDGNKVKICKICNATLKNKERKAAKVAAAASAEEAPAEA